MYNPNPKVPEVIAVYFDDHPPPHFHAFYSDREVVIRIRDGVVTAGDFPKRALAHVLEWRALHVAELEEDWELARNHQPLNRIAPLE